MKLVTDTGIVFTRELRPLVRDPFTVIFGLIQPLIFLGLFAPLLRDLAPLEWFVPGVLVMLALFGTSTTGANLIQEMQTGSHERQLVTPLSRPSLLLGRALKEIAPTVVQALVVVAVTVPFGLRPSPAGVLAGLLLLAVFSVGMGALSYTLALAVKNQDWLFWVVQQTLLFPMLILAGMLLPLDNGPGWLRTAAHVNPLTYVVDAERALFAGDLWNRTVAEGVVAAALTAAVGLWVGVRAMHRAA
ncbi:ABC transporter permease [Virgisporangium ochraceum]|uniref:Transport permease protein n=1 Tax=Virgisporangium ochraceum TaxID=65505 RepID=A0A8J4A1C7_9ACTN|nr:ABC transporter permease [Virgisporangium ochraceum]GIJ73396.1 transport permease protein [Virgisporangium ochraceum]